LPSHSMPAQDHEITLVPSDKALMTGRQEVLGSLVRQTKEVIRVKLKKIKIQLYTFKYIENKCTFS